MIKFLPSILARLTPALLFAVLPLHAQIGDKAGEAQLPIVPAELIPPSPALSPEEELKTFEVAPGFRVELVASEPLIGDPVVAQFSPDGRLWVVEMRSYMPHLDGHGEDLPTGRVVVLTDTNKDGRMDKSDVFLDGLVMPRALTFVGDGVLIGAPPMLWFCRDTNGDGTCDEKTEVANDYGVQVDPARPELANPERAPNSLLSAYDNWIYSGAYTAKFRLHEGKWQRDVTTFRGQWGLSQDDWGRFFYNSNSDQLRADLIPSHYLGRNPFHARPTGTNYNTAVNQLVWPIRVTPGINRGYRPEMLRDYKLKEFTAACAPWIYQGDLFPAEFSSNAFVCEPAAHLIKRNLLTTDNGKLIATEAYHEREFLASTDERFRPVNLTTGPDGALYVVDFYRGILQHRISLTSYLREHIERQHLDTPIGLGRIWRIVPEKGSVPVQRNLDAATPAQLIAALSHANSWQRETAQRLLVESGDLTLAADLEEVVTAGTAPLGRRHALWTLAGLGTVNWAPLKTALSDPDPRVRLAAWRVSEALLPTKDRAALLEKWLELSRTESSPEVQWQIALSLGEAQDPAADAAMAALSLRAGDHPFLRDAALTGLMHRELELLEKLLEAPKWKDPSPAATLFLSGLARCVQSERQPERIDRLFALIAAQPAPLQVNLLSSFAANPDVIAKRPVKLPAEPAALATLRTSSDKPLGAALAKINPFFTWPGKPGGLVETPVVPLTTEQEERFTLGKTLYTGICSACHQPHGLGMAGLAPPLVDSEWVTGSPERLANIVLHGVRGPIQVKGQYFNLDMPALGILENDALAAILTYIRREWNHTATPIDPTFIEGIRRKHATRTDAWTAPELLKIPELTAP